MPLKKLGIELKYDSMLNDINAIQKGIKSKKFDGLEHNEKKEIYATLFASRSAADAVRGKRSSLKVAASPQEWEKKRNELILSSSFQTFLETQGHDKMKTLLSEGHGGAAEDAFQEYVKEQAKLPSDVPERYMPTAKERITQQQTKAKTLDPQSPEAIAAFAEIFRARRSVDAVRKKGSTVETKINGQKYAQAPDLSNNAVFKSFVGEKGAEFRDTVTADNGGAGEEMFQTYLKELDHIPAEAPSYYMPTAYDHLESLKEKLKKGGSAEENLTRLTEIMATRDSVNAVRKQPSSLQPQLSPSALNSAYETWSKCTTFQNYVKEHPAEAVSAGSDGHGGLLQDKFRSYVTQQDHISPDVPKAYMPTAYDHLEELKKKLADGSEFYRSSPEQKLKLTAEIMASRQVVNAERNKPDTLKKQMDPQALEETYQKWTKCKAFQEYVQSTDPKIQIEVHEAAHAGHGGALGDKFREYLTKRNILEDDIPEGFMPSALTRTATLVQKIKDGPDLSKEEKTTLYTELMASRASVEATRGKSKTLEKTLDAKKLKEARESLQNSTTFKNFINDDNRALEIREAATEGHGGALEDKFQDYVLDLDHIPEDVPNRYMPTALKRVDKLTEKIKNLNYPLEDHQIDLFAEMMGTRQSVGAEGTKDGPLKVNLDAKKLQSDIEQWKKCKSFRDFVAGSEDAKKAALEGHGGKLIEKYKEHVMSLDKLPEDLPDSVIPTALERTEALRSKIREAQRQDDKEAEVALFAQVLAARRNADAVTGKKDSLKKKLDPKAVNKMADDLVKCQAFQRFFNSQQNLNIARNSVSSGHGGDLEEGFKYYVSTVAQITTDIPEAYLPTAEYRIDGIKKQINSNNFRNASLDTKVSLYAELLGARQSVNAKRNQVETLREKVNPKEVRSTADALVKCSAFRKFIEEHPEEAKKAATTGHGGELEDKFKNYVLNMDTIPEDVPKEYMPTALQRTEVLQKKIKSREFRNYPTPKQNMFYKELCATRATVNSIRKKKSSLDVTMDAKRLHEMRQGLNSGEGPDKSFDTLSREKLYDAATTGHGGALEDLLKKDVLRQAAESGTLPQKVPQRYKPSINETRLAIQKEINEKNLAMRRVEPEQLKNQVAGMMYLFLVETKARRNGQPVPELNAKYMEEETKKLKGDKAFQAMFKDANTIRATRNDAGFGRNTTLFESYNRNANEIKAQKQEELQQLQNEIRPQQREQEPVIHRNPDEQVQPQRRRANSFAVPQNDPLQL